MTSSAGDCNPTLMPWKRVRYFREDWGRTSRTANWGLGRCARCICRSLPLSLIIWLMGGSSRYTHAHSPSTRHFWWAGAGTPHKKYLCPQQRNFSVPLLWRVGCQGYGGGPVRGAQSIIEPSKYSALISGELPILSKTQKRPYPSNMVQNTNGILKVYLECKYTNQTYT